MPTRDTAPLGAPCWIELFTTDVDRACSFYGDLLGWKPEDMGEEYGGYVNLALDGTWVAGCMGAPADHQEPANFWSVYLAVDDADATVEAATAHGGGVFLPPMDVMALGRMAMLADATGAGVGIWQAGEFGGFRVLGEPGAPSWFELHTREYDKAIGFYQDVFGWDTHVAADEPGFRYTTLGEEEDGLAGIMDASVFPDGAPTGWSVYLGTADADASLAKVTELGGQVLVPAEDTPHGRLATAADPMGAVFRLVQGS